ncbi:hypothetical protein JYT83_01435 [bacterium AH-315-F18]|nr:hypothetical protein [bacterium AH-315-F18]
MTDKKKYELTPARLAANQANAQKSTGPKSEHGKAVVSQNALRHGLRAQVVVIPGEDPEQYEDFRMSLLVELAPKGPLEVALAENVCNLLWRRRRITMVESGLFGWERRREHQDTRVWNFCNSDKYFGSLSRYEAGIRRTLYRDLLELERLQAKRQGDQGPSGLLCAIDELPQ